MQTSLRPAYTTTKSMRGSIASKYFACIMVLRVQAVDPAVRHPKQVRIVRVLVHALHQQVRPGLVVVEDGAGRRAASDREEANPFSPELRAASAVRVRREMGGPFHTRRDLLRRMEDLQAVGVVGEEALI